MAGKQAQREVRSGEKEGSWMVYLRSKIRAMSTREKTQYHLRNWSQTCRELAPRPRQASASKSATVVVREAHDDERVVKDLLEDGASAVSSGLPSGEDNENMLLPFRDIEVDVEKSLDKDDQETDRVLREAAMAQGVRQSEERRQVDVGVEESSSVAKTLSRSFMIRNNVPSVTVHQKFGR